jgi:hypothetical protein
MNKKDLSERDICTKFINPAIEKAGWNMRTQVREEVSFTDGRIIVQGKMHTRGKSKRADYILYCKFNIGNEYVNVFSKQGYDLEIRAIPSFTLSVKDYQTINFGLDYRLSSFINRTEPLQRVCFGFF